MDAVTRVRGLSTPDAVVVVFVAALAGAFVAARWPVGTLLIAAIGALYAALRVTRGLPLAWRLLAALPMFFVPVLIAGLLSSAGY